MTKKLWLAVGAFLVLALLSYVVLRPSNETARPQANSAAQSGRRGAGGPAPVEVAKVQKIPAAAELTSIGTLTSDESVKLAAEVAGRIESISFQEGGPIAAGSVIAKLDDALIRAEVNDATARLKLADANFQRANALSQSGTGTKRARDEAVSALETAKASLELARVQLEKTDIRAPFAAIAGLREVSVGAFVQPGTSLVNLEKIDVLKVDFRLPEINLADVKPGMKIQVRVDAFPDRVFEGEIYAIDPLLDVNGRAIRVRAKLANKDLSLRPGLFARITIPLARSGDVLIMPESAVVPRGGETLVFRVADGKAQEAKVRLGHRKAGEVEVLEGVSEGDTVVISGQMRLRTDTPVEVVGGGSQ